MGSELRHECETIDGESQRIQRLADVALKAEVRNTRLEVVNGTGHWKLVRQEVIDLKLENQRLKVFLEAKFEMVQDTMYRMNQEIRYDFNS
ncbi:MAG: hypothetical protein Q9162_005275 [Coniocarpon cinnabarinum]